MTLHKARRQAAGGEGWQARRSGRQGEGEEARKPGSRSYTPPSENLHVPWQKSRCTAHEILEVDLKSGKNWYKYDQIQPIRELGVETRADFSDNEEATAYLNSLLSKYREAKSSGNGG